MPKPDPLWAPRAEQLRLRSRCNNKTVANIAAAAWNKQGYADLPPLRSADIEAWLDRRYPAHAAAKVDLAHACGPLFAEETRHAAR